MRRLAVGALLVLTGCSAGYPLEGPEGTYECRSPVAGTPVYRFAATAPTTILWAGTDRGVEFVDLATGQPVVLREDSLDYRCVFHERQRTPEEWRAALAALPGDTARAANLQRREETALRWFRVVGVVLGSGLGAAIVAAIRTEMRHPGRLPRGRPSAVFPS